MYSWKKNKPPVHLHHKISVLQRVLTFLWKNQHELLSFSLKKKTFYPTLPQITSPPGSLGAYTTLTMATQRPTPFLIGRPLGSGEVTHYPSDHDRAVGVPRSGSCVGCESFRKGFISPFNFLANTTPHHRAHVSPRQHLNFDKQLPAHFHSPYVFFFSSIFR